MNETCGMLIRYFSGLKSKIYSFIAEENHESKIGKGIDKNVVDD